MKTILVGLSSALMLWNATAYGAFSLEQLHEASKKSTEHFATANPGHVAHFVGYKTWKSGEDAKVKIYVSHGGMNMEFDYLCFSDENAVECNAE